MYCVQYSVQCAVLGEEVSLVRKCAVYSVQCSVARLVLLDSVQRALCSVSQCSAVSGVLLESGPVGKPERLISPAAALQVEPFIIVLFIIIVMMMIIK